MTTIYAFCLLHDNTRSQDLREELECLNTCSGMSKGILYLLLINSGWDVGQMQGSTGWVDVLQRKNCQYIITFS